MLELEHGFRVVDVYAMLPPNGTSTGGRHTTSTPDRLEREMHQAGITRSVVFPPANAETSYVGANNGVARRSVDRPFISLARINGTRRPETSPIGCLRNSVSTRQPYHTTPDDIEKYAYDDRFHGFVIDPSVDDYPDEDVLETLEAVGLPVLVSGDGDVRPAHLEDTLLERSFPVVVAHFGGHPLERSRMHETIELLDRYDDCYVETSFVQYREVLERALLEHPDRVLFGSGVPARHPNVAVMEILTLDVSKDKLWRAFSKNVCRVFEALSPAGER